MVRLENVTKVYGRDTVVDNVSLHVAKGEIMVVIGPSGCGKTTTLKMINRLIPYTSGRITVNGRDVNQVDPVQLRRQIGYVIQQVGLIPHFTIRDNISFVLSLSGAPKALRNRRAEELIRTMGLPESYLDKHPRQLSGGQQQRVGVARALAADPDLVLMDEPFTAVDPIAREQLQDELLRVQKEVKKTIVFVTHDIQEAFKIGTRIALMRAGRLVKVGTPLSMMAEKDEFIRSFIGRKAVISLLDSLPVVQVMDRSVPVVRVGERPPQDGPAGWEFMVAVDDGEMFAGVLARDAGPGAVLTKDALSPGPGILPPDTTILEAMERMLTGGRTWLPVVDEGRFLGLVTFQACMAFLHG